MERRFHYVATPYIHNPLVETIISLVLNNKELEANDKQNIQTRA